MVLLAGWRAVAGVASRFGEQVPGGVRATAFSIMGVLAIVAQAPYKLTVHPERPVVLVDSQRCYLLGERDSDARIYCPGAQEPRVRTVSRLAAPVTGCGFEENIFIGTINQKCQ